VVVLFKITAKSAIGIAQHDAVGEPHARYWPRGSKACMRCTRDTAAIRPLVARKEKTTRQLSTRGRN